jgi:hypothetical protein
MTKNLGESKLEMEFRVRLTSTKEYFVNSVSKKEKHGACSMTIIHREKNARYPYICKCPCFAVRSSSNIVFL